MLPPRLYLAQPLDTVRDVAIRAGIGLQLETHRERSGDLSPCLEHTGKIVQELVEVVGARRWGLRRALEPVDGLGRHATIEAQAAEGGGGRKSQRGDTRRFFEGQGRAVKIAG